MKEHTRKTKAFKKGSNVATHAWLNDHSIDFKSAHVIDKGNLRVRKTLESWHTAITNDADNNAKQLPRQYSIMSYPGYSSIFKLLSCNNYSVLVGKHESLLFCCLVLIFYAYILLF